MRIMCFSVKKTLGPVWSIALNMTMILVLLLARRVPPALAAGTIVVNTTQDVYDGSLCSLRNAVHAANTNARFGGCPAGNTIQIPAGNYQLTILNPNKTETDESAGDLDIRASMTVSGASPFSTRVFAAGQAFGDRIFHISSGAVVTIQNMRISGGYVSGGYGGGVYNEGGTLNLSSAILDGNTTGVNAGAGGGIANTSGTLRIDYSTISSNSSAYGGGIFNQGTLNLNHSAIYNNAFSVSGGGLNNYSPPTVIPSAVIINSTIAFNTGVQSSPQVIPSGGGISSAGVLTIQNSTIADNSYGGLYIFGNNPTVQNSILARNLPQLDCVIDSPKIGINNVISLGHNLVDNINPGNSSECAFTGPGDILNQDAMLTTNLASNAGATKTYGFVKGSGTKLFSPAIDAIPVNDPSCPSDDQRGFARPVDGNGDGVAQCDIGAYEERQLYYVNLPIIRR